MVVQELAIESAVFQTSRARLEASSGEDSDAFLELSAWIQSSAHISRRCSKTSKSLKKKLKKCKIQTHGVKALWV